MGWRHRASCAGSLTSTHFDVRRFLCTATAVDVCRTIRGVDTDIRKIPGTALASDSTGDMIYTPPDGTSRLRDLLANWERYLHDDTSGDVPQAVGNMM